MRSVAPKEIPTSEIFRAIVPYMVIGILMMLLVAWVPWLATAFPKWMLGR